MSHLIILPAAAVTVADSAAAWPVGASPVSRSKKVGEWGLTFAPSIVYHTLTRSDVNAGRNARRRNDCVRKISAIDR